MNAYAQKSVFEPLLINGVTIPNRIAKSAMAEGACNADGGPTPALMSMYERWAKGGVGLLFTGMAYIRRGYSYTDKEIGLYDDGLIAPLRELPEVVHRHGGRIFAQISHASPQLPRTKAKVLGSVAPSPGLNRTNFLIDRALRDDEIRALARDFGEAARRARDAGFDGVQLHGAHGYLISRFLSPLHNRRQDQWGGNSERRLAFLHEVFNEMRDKVGRDYPITIKLNVRDGQRGGLELTEAIKAARTLEQWGFDAIEVSAGTGDVGLGFYPNRGDIPLDLAVKFLGHELPLLKPVLPFVARPILAHAAKAVAFRDEAYFAMDARRVAEAVSIPVICQGGIRSLKTISNLIEKTPIAMVALARPFVREPGLVRRWREGREAPATCKSCNRCFVQIGLGERLRCWHRETSVNADSRFQISAL